MKLNISNETSKSLLIFCVILIEFYFLYSIGFTTHDDIKSFLMALTNGSFPNGDHFSNAVAVAKSAGRVHFLVGYFIWLAAYLIQSPLYLFIIRILGISLNGILFEKLVFEIYKNSNISLCFTLIFLGIQQVSWEHSVLVSYPGLYTLASASFIYSLLCHIRGAHKTSGLLYFVSLFFYEMFVLYFSIFIVFEYINKSNTLRQKIRSLKWHFVALTTYLTTYILFRIYFPGVYEGNQVHQVSIENTFKVVFQYSISTLPGYFYFLYSDFFRQAQMLTLGDRLEWFFQNIRQISFWVPLIAFIFLSRRLNQKELRFFRPVGAGLFMLLGCTISNFLLALTPQKQEWVIQNGGLGYTTNFFCSFFVSFFIAHIVFGVIKFTASLKQKIIAKAGYIFSLILFGSFSFLTASTNHLIGHHQSLDHSKFRLLDVLLGEYIQMIPAGSTILAPDLWKTDTMAQISEETFWSDYIRYNFHKDIFVKNRAATKSDVSLLRSGRLWKITYEDFFSRNYSVLTLSRISSFKPEFDGSELPFVSEMYLASEGDISHLEFPLPKKFFKALPGKCKGGAFLPKCYFFLADFQNDLELPFFDSNGVEYTLFDGVQIFKTVDCYPSEKNEHATWSWCRKMGKLSFWNTQGNRKQLLKFEIVFHSFGTYSIELNGVIVKTATHLKNQLQPYSIPIEVKPGLNTLRIISSAEQSPLSNEDKREALYMIANLTLAPN